MKRLQTTLRINIFASLLLLCALQGYSQPVQRYFDVILCLDDRLAEADQIERDVKLIRQVYDKFRKSAHRGKWYVNATDAFRVLAVPQHGMSDSVLYYSRELQIDLSHIPYQERKRAVNAFAGQLDERLEKLYALAYRGSEKSAYNGANIWRFFNGPYGDEMSAHGDRRAEIFILTDGYIDFEVEEPRLSSGRKSNHTDFVHKYCQHTDWQAKLCSEDAGILHAQIDLNKASVQVLEMNSKCESYYEGAVLKQIWQDWLVTLGASEIRTMLRTTSVPTLY